MANLPDHIKALWQAYLADQATEDQVKEFFAFLKDPANESLIESQFQQVLQDSAPVDIYPSNEESKAEALESLFALRPSLQDAREKQYPVVAPLRRVHFLPRMFRYIAIAILIIGVGVFTYLLIRPAQKDNTANLTQVEKDIPAGGNKATLTLADGRQIILDNTADGYLANQGNSRVRKLSEGQLVYDNSGQASKEVIWNTMTTPKGGRYQLSLPDGSKVWLNAASSITFPASFATNKREVKVTGEVYFEIAKDRQKPFFINAADMQIQVLGTSFNVNVYADEPAAKVTLVEGAIAVDEHRLQPGQALLNGNIVTADLEQDLAWKNGAFNLNNKTLPELMRQIARWYDLEIRYEGAVQSRTFEGEIGMNLSLAQCIRALERMQVHCRLEGRTLVVLP